MNEAIKGQDKLKIAVEKLEAEIFKDWPTRTIGIHAHGVLMLNRSLRFKVTPNLTITNVTSF